MKLEHTAHRHGGAIREVHSIGHETYKGASYWFIVCDIEWGDGSKSTNARVMPNLIVYGDDSALAVAEYDRIMGKINNYLCAAGTWNAKGTWKPKAKEGSAPINL